MAWSAHDWVQPLDGCLETRALAVWFSSLGRCVRGPGAGAAKRGAGASASAPGARGDTAKQGGLAAHASAGAAGKAADDFPAGALLPRVAADGGTCRGVHDGGELVENYEYFDKFFLRLNKVRARLAPRLPHSSSLAPALPAALQQAAHLEGFLLRFSNTPPHPPGCAISAKTRTVTKQQAARVATARAGPSR